MNNKKTKTKTTNKDANLLKSSNKNNKSSKSIKIVSNTKKTNNKDEIEIINQNIEIDLIDDLNEKITEDNKSSKSIKITTNNKKTNNKDNIKNITQNIEIDVIDSLNEKITEEINDANTIKKENIKNSKRELKAESKFIRKNNKPHKINSQKEHLWNNELIKLINVSKSYTNNYTNYHILHGIDLTIYEKEFVVIYGPSGSGKTTLLSIISGLDRPTTGSSYIVGQNTIRLNESKLTKLRSNYIGYIYQQYGLLDILTVEDNIKVTQGLQKDKSKKIDLDELLHYVGLYEHKKKKASQLSGGQSQRVAICRALIKNPKILFGDEPTGAIHIDAAKQIMNLFLKINREYGTTIVIVTHNQNMLKLGDRVIKVQDGKIVENYLNKHRTPVEKISWDDQE